MIKTMIEKSWQVSHHAVLAEKRWSSGVSSSNAKPLLQVLRPDGNDAKTDVIGAAFRLVAQTAG